MGFSPPALRATAPLMSGMPPPKIWPGRRMTVGRPWAGADGARPVDDRHRRDVDELFDAVFLASVDDVLRAGDGAALVLGPAALHRGAAVDDDLRALDGAIDRDWIAEVTEAVLDAVLGLGRDAALEHADAVAVGAEALDRGPAEKARGAVTR
jgi:hypothetical protein